MAKKKAKQADRALDFINRLARPVRIFLVSLISLLTIAILITAINLVYFERINEDVTFQQILVFGLVAVGIMAQIGGWHLMIGWGDPWQATRNALYYLIFGLVELVVVITLLITGGVLLA